MKTIPLLVSAFVAGLLSIGGAVAKEKAEPPAGSTGECKDGTYTDAPSKSGACSGHKGVKEWFGKAAAAPEKATKAAGKAETPAPATKPTKSQPYERPATPAAGGGNGKVWINTSSKVYHCEGDEWYGKTKKGEYKTESEAKAAGARPARGKVCS